MLSEPYLKHYDSKRETKTHINDHIEGEGGACCAPVWISINMCETIDMIEIYQEDGKLLLLLLSSLLLV